MNEEEIIKERYFPYEGITKEERDFYLYLLSNCKDIERTNDGIRYTPMEKKLG